MTALNIIGIAMSQDHLDNNDFKYKYDTCWSEAQGLLNLHETTF